MRSSCKQIDPRKIEGLTHSDFFFSLTTNRINESSPVKVSEGQERPECHSNGTPPNGKILSVGIPFNIPRFVSFQLPWVSPLRLCVLQVNDCPSQVRTGPNFMRLLLQTNHCVFGFLSWTIAGQHSLCSHQISKQYTVIKLIPSLLRT